MQVKRFSFIVMGILENARSMPGLFKGEAKFGKSGCVWTFPIKFWIELVYVSYVWNGSVCSQKTSQKAKRFSFKVMGIRIYELSFKCMNIYGI